MDGLPIVTPDEMKRLEKSAFDAGESEQKYMENAGTGIAKAVESFSPISVREVFLLVGKGNNGGDAFVAGEWLRSKGYFVKAFCLYPIKECSSLSQKMAKRFEKAGGEIVVVEKAPVFNEGVILDGLLGTGFRGKVEGLMAEVIESANQSGRLIFAIDIPSGLESGNGEVATVAIQAYLTIYLGLPKLGFFIGKGWDHIGKLIRVDFGLPEKYTEGAKAQAFLLSLEKASLFLPKIERSRHKYQAGYVLAIAGCPGMPGAALMSCLAALKAGAGIIRLFYPKGMKEELATAPYELIKEEWDLQDDSRIFEEAKRAKSFIVGPGIGRSEKMEEALKTLLAKISLPCVVDADALYFLAKNREMTLPEKTILTPHHQEMERIIEKKPTFEQCQAFVKEKNVTVVLKGAPSVVFHPHTSPLVIPHGDPGMATAGTGDVLTGIIAAFAAQGLGMRKAAALGVTLHALAGEIAAKAETSYGVIATDLIHYLPEAFQAIQKEKK